MDVTVNNYGFSCSRNIAKAVMRGIKKNIKDWNCPLHIGNECNTKPPRGVLRRVAAWLAGGSPPSGFCVVGADVVEGGEVCGGAWSVWINEDEDECGHCEWHIRSEGEG